MFDLLTNLGRWLLATLRGSEDGTEAGPLHVLRTDSSGRLEVAMTYGEMRLEDLADVAAPLTPAAGELLRYTGAEWDADALAFTDLEDAPASYGAYGGAVVRVNGTATGLDFLSSSADPGASQANLITDSNGRLILKGLALGSATPSDNFLALPSATFGGGVGLSPSTPRLEFASDRVSVSDGYLEPGPLDDWPATGETGIGRGDAGSAAPFDESSTLILAGESLVIGANRVFAARVDAAGSLLLGRDADLDAPAPRALISQAGDSESLIEVARLEAIPAGSEVAYEGFGAQLTFAAPPVGSATPAIVGSLSVQHKTDALAQAILTVNSIPALQTVGAMRWYEDGASACMAIMYTASASISAGQVVCFDQSNTQRVKPVPTSGNELDMPIGVALESASAGGSVWIAILGLVYVLPISTVTAAVGNVLYCSTAAAGRVEQAASVGSAQHWREVGHWYENGSRNGVAARAQIHFN